MSRHSEAVRHHDMVRRRRMERVRAYNQAGRTAGVISNVLFLGCLLFFAVSLSGANEVVCLSVGACVVFGIVVAAPLWLLFNLPKTRRMFLESGPPVLPEDPPS